eukprot:COSAG01_NODE_20969_length_924_cov_50.539394_1_plen_67_part_10
MIMAAGGSSRLPPPPSPVPEGHQPGLASEAVTSGTEGTHQFDPVHRASDEVAAGLRYFATSARRPWR